MWNMRQSFPRKMPQSGWLEERRQHMPPIETKFPAKPRSGEPPSSPAGTPPSSFLNNYLPSATASAQRIPSIAEETIPPE